MYEESSCFDPNPMVDNNVGFCATETTFPVSHQFQPPLGSTTNSFNDDLKLPTMEEFSVFPSVTSLPNSETQNQNINNNNHFINQMIQESNWGVSEDNSGFFMNTSHPNTTTTPIPDLLSLLHLPRCSMSLPSSNLSDIMAGSCFTYDPLFHLNLPPQPPLIPSNDYSGYLLGIDTNTTTQRDESNVGDENNNAQFDSGIIEFSKEIRRKGRGKRKNKPFTTERERRCHLNERYEALKLLIPNPSKGDRASILQDGIDYINELRRRVSELKYLVERKRCGGRHKNNELDNNINNNNSNDHDNDEDNIDDENMEKKPESDVIDQCSSNNSLRCSWLQRKSKVTEVDVRIVDDEVTIKVVQKKKINCLLLVSKVLDQLQLDLYHVAGGQIGEHYSFLFNTKIYEGSTIYASAIANRVIEVVDKHYMAALPINNY
ncbi:Myc-type basic helix-loop-helix (bHLH) domain [Arabidopsis thaliana x Arabidopsis arenosa]|uniref:Myc-type basic helix-loop-helix (BHLH) domain n=1 Tax=Arabidopsis thaliana x Arabidopsis arenosa TaxID=1240361 RepID=A0A8T2A9V8_9BRAS|nr:Myc-type basic helix-loop-helix (bHLH) domain [Arabidopsis thaliana x Arabidopsis arenosa]